ncbi:MAG: polysaccharide biosynthesis/export family protein [Mariprofundaceae bacterium]|nr:polysaccharide biosynthesis/export family protein [Mariprofundaceae bacterium]
MNYMAVLLFTMVVLNACAIAPGMRIDESRLHASAETDTQHLEIELRPITGAVLKQIRDAQQAQEADRAFLPVYLQAENGAYQYHVMPRDILQITVWDHPELTLPEGQFRSAAESGSIVHGDGHIFYPYVGNVDVAGKSVEQIRVALTRKLSKFMPKPQLEVRVSSYRSQHVYVTGEVMKPGAYTISDIPMHVLDALHIAGGARTRTLSNQINEADLEHVQLTRSGKRYTINMNRLLNEGDLLHNYLLQDGDLLHVPDNMNNKVFVLGEVKSAGSLLIHNGFMSLADALADSGGFDMASANTSRIYVIRSGVKLNHHASRNVSESSMKPLIYRLDGSAPDALILADQFQLEPRDVVFVSTAAVVAWGRVLGQLSSTIQAIAIGRALTR